MLSLPGDIIHIPLPTPSVISARRSGAAIINLVGSLGESQRVRQASREPG
jgi:hypothetical protein